MLYSSDPRFQMAGGTVARGPGLGRGMRFESHFKSYAIRKSLSSMTVTAAAARALRALRLATCPARGGEPLRLRRITAMAPVTVTPPSHGPRVGSRYCQGLDLARRRAELRVRSFHRRRGRRPWVVTARARLKRAENLARSKLQNV